MLHRLKKLLSEPAFKHEPLAVLWRTGLWALCVAVRRCPKFRLSSGGERLRVPPDMRYTSLTAFILRDWTEPDLRELQQFVKPGAVFIDIGANIGLYTLKGAKLAGPSGRVIAVEPGSVSADLLEQNVALNGFRTVSVVRKAVSDSIGKGVLHHNPLGNDPQAFSLLPAADAQEAETVELTTLDALVEQFQLTRIDCIKIDVEGAEPLVIEGGKASLLRWHPIVIFEVNSLIPTRRGDELNSAWTKLAALGYSFEQLRNGRRVAIDSLPSTFGNVIAVPAR